MIELRAGDSALRLARGDERIEQARGLASTVMLCHRSCMAPREIEPSGSSDSGPCDCCGGLSRRVWGFIYHEGEAEAAYFVEWTIGGVAEHGAHFDVIIGRWGNGTTSKDRVAVSLAFRHEDTGPQFMVIDAKDRAAGQSDLVGHALGREEVLGSALAQTVFEIIDEIWLQDRRIDEITRGAA